MKIALVQMPMAYSIAENIATIVSSLKNASEQGADVAAFPEFAVIGYHYEMGAELSRANIDRALAAISQACAEYQIAALVGTPFYGGDSAEKPEAAVVVYSATGDLIAVTPKIMLSGTEIKLDLFSPGDASQRQTFQMGGHTCAILICCELSGEKGNTKANYHELMPLLDKKPDIVFVPGVFDMADSDEISTISTAHGLAKAYQTNVIVLNWPEWGGPDADGYMGASVAIDTNGQTLVEALKDEPDIVFVEM